MRQIMYYNLMRHFSWKRAFFTLFYFFLHLLAVGTFLLLRLLDELFYPAYKKQIIKAPLYIIANPRSGTTFLHRLMSLDEEKYHFTYLYSALFPSVTLIRLIENAGILDRKSGGYMRRFFSWLDGIFFGGWKDIHPMGFNETEEDEPMFSIPLMTPGIYMLCPYLDEMEDTKFLDTLSEKEKKEWMDYYQSSIQRFMYAMKTEKIYMAKNVLNTGRIEAILGRFPDARFVYLARHPYEGLPSLISMFTAPWKAHSPECTGATPQAKAWGQLAIDYYLYFAEMKKKIPPENLYYISFSELINNPAQVVEKVYAYYDLSLGENFRQKLLAETGRQKAYKSKHHYTLEEYGWTKAGVNSQMRGFMMEYGFNIEEDTNKE